MISMLEKTCPSLSANTTTPSCLALKGSQAHHSAKGNSSVGRALYSVWWKHSSRLKKSGVGGATGAQYMWASWRVWLWLVAGHSQAKSKRGPTVRSCVSTLTRDVPGGCLDTPSPQVFHWCKKNGGASAPLFLAHFHTSYPHKLEKFETHVMESHQVT